MLECMVLQIYSVQDHRTMRTSIQGADAPCICALRGPAATGDGPSVPALMRRTRGLRPLRRYAAIPARLTVRNVSVAFPGHPAG